RKGITRAVKPAAIHRDCDRLRLDRLSTENVVDKLVEGDDTTAFREMLQMHFKSLWPNKTVKRDRRNVFFRVGNPFIAQNAPRRCAGCYRASEAALELSAV